MKKLGKILCAQTLLQVSRCSWGMRKLPVLQKNTPWYCRLQYFPCATKCRVLWLAWKAAVFCFQRKALFLKCSLLFQTVPVSLMKGYSFYLETVSPVLYTSKNTIISISDYISKCACLRFAASLKLFFSFLHHLL